MLGPGVLGLIFPPTAGQAGCGGPCSDGRNLVLVGICRNGGKKRGKNPLRAPPGGPNGDQARGGRGFGRALAHFPISPRMGKKIPGFFFRRCCDQNKGWVRGGVWGCRQGGTKQRSFGQVDSFHADFAGRLVAREGPFVFREGQTPRGPIHQRRIPGYGIPITRDTTESPEGDHRMGPRGGTPSGGRIVARFVGPLLIRKYQQPIWLRQATLVALQLHGGVSWHLGGW